MWLVLCSAGDQSAHGIVHQLETRGLHPLVVLTPDVLHYSFRWQHRISRVGSVFTSFTLADGTEVNGDRVRGVLNRLAALPSHLVTNLAPQEREYALQEWTALHISWLSALRCPVLNLPVMQELCGAWRHPTEWALMAGQAGLETLPVAVSADEENSARPQSEPKPTSTRTIVVVDGVPVDCQLPATVAAACGRLSELANTRLLGIDLEQGSWRFLQASPRPNLQAGGALLADALFEVLSGNV